MPPIVFILVAAILFYLFVQVFKTQQQINPDPPMPHIGVGRIILAVLVGIILIAIMAIVFGVFGPNFGLT